MNRLGFGLGLISMLSAARVALAAPHLHYDDGGAVNWKPSWPIALHAARTTGKPIFVDAGIEN
jgi:hypothetical protein